MTPYLKYARHFKLPGFNALSQESLLNAKAVVVGAGGLAHPFLTYIACAGVRHITIIDSDKISISNLNRQFYFSDEDIGVPKTLVTKKLLKKINPNAFITTFDVKASPINYKQLFHGADIVIDCTDGLTTKYFLNDACISLGIPFIHGAVSAYAGQVLLVNKESACLRCVFGPLPPANEIPTCASVGILGAACGLVGSLMALQFIKAITNKNKPHNNLLSIDAFNGKVKSFKTIKDPNCEACGNNPTINPEDSFEYVATK